MNNFSKNLNFINFILILILILISFISLISEIKNTDSFLYKTIKPYFEENDISSKLNDAFR